MFEFITVLFVIAVVAYVAMPLLKPQHQQKNRTTTKELRVIEFEHQQQMLQNVIDDLKFDYDTGKLSEEDFQSLAAEHQKSQAELKAGMDGIRGSKSAKQKRDVQQHHSQGRRKGKSKAPLTCPACNSAVSEDDKFCSSCGANLT